MQCLFKKLNCAFILYELKVYDGKIINFIFWTDLINCVRKCFITFPLNVPL